MCMEWAPGSSILCMDAAPPCTGPETEVLGGRGRPWWLDRDIAEPVLSAKCGGGGIGPVCLSSSRYVWGLTTVLAVETSTSFSSLHEERKTYKSHNFICNNSKTLNFINLLTSRGHFLLQWV